MSQIAEQASIHPSARIGEDVRVGPYCVIGPEVELGDGCELMNKVTLDGRTHIGRHNIIYPNCVIGSRPQDLKYQGSPTETIIGDRNVFRENVTVHRGTEMGGGKTVIGDENFIMVGAHVAHDCHLEDRILLSNAAMLAGHVKVESNVVISAMTGIHHFVTVGRHSYIGAYTPVRRDVPPYVKVNGDPPRVRGLNSEGLKRHGFTEQDLEELKETYKELFRTRRDGGSLAEDVERMRSTGTLGPHAQYLCDSVWRSCQSRFWRALEARRQDRFEDRLQHCPYEVRDNGDEEVD